MGSVKGKVWENPNSSKETGFFEGRVIAINPSKEELEKLLGTEVEKEVEYTSVDSDGKIKATVVFWLKNVKNGKLKSLRFYLKDEERTNSVREGEDKVRKKQYINTVGMTAWADSDTNLPSWFLGRPYRVANRGEEEFYNFVINWLNKLDLRDPESELYFDWGRLMRGDVRELKSQIKGDYDDTIVCLQTIKTVDKDGYPVDYEQIYNRKFLPGFVMKQIRLKSIDKNFITAAKNTNKNERSKLQKFVLDITDEQFGIREHFTLGELEEYDPSKNIMSGNKVISEDDADY
jgi:hypothetical protein